MYFVGKIEFKSSIYKAKLILNCDENKKGSVSEINHSIILNSMKYTYS